MAKIETSNFKRFIGIWKTEGTILSDKDNSTLTGTDSYQFILAGNYILHKADVKMGNEKSETFEIIELGSSTEQAKMQYFNSKGEKGAMTSSLTGNDYIIQGDKIKFEGTINNENTKLVGKWYLQTDAEEWIEFIDLKLTKQN